MSPKPAGAHRGAAIFAAIIVLALGACAPAASADLTLNSGSADFVLSFRTPSQFLSP